MVATVHQHVGPSNGGINHFGSSPRHRHIGDWVNSVGAVNRGRKTWRVHVALEVDVIVATREYIVSLCCLSCGMKLVILLVIPSQTVEMAVRIRSRSHYSRVVTKVGLVVVGRRKVRWLEVSRGMAMSCTRPEGWATQTRDGTQTARCMGRDQISSFLKHGRRSRGIMMKQCLLLEVKHGALPLLLARSERPVDGSQSLFGIKSGCLGSKWEKKWMTASKDEDDPLKTCSADWTTFSSSASQRRRRGRRGSCTWIKHWLNRYSKYPSSVAKSDYISIPSDKELGQRNRQTYLGMRTIGGWFDESKGNRRMVLEGSGRGMVQVIRIRGLFETRWTIRTWLSHVHDGVNEGSQLDKEKGKERNTRSTRSKLTMAERHWEPWAIHLCGVPRGPALTERDCRRRTRRRIPEKRRERGERKARRQVFCTIDRKRERGDQKPVLVMRGERERRCASPSFLPLISLHFSLSLSLFKVLENESETKRVKIDELKKIRGKI